MTQTLEDTECHRSSECHCQHSPANCIWRSPHRKYWRGAVETSATKRCTFRRSVSQTKRSLVIRQWCC